MLVRDSTGRYVDFFYFPYHIFFGTNIFPFNTGLILYPRYTTRGHERCDLTGGPGNTRQSENVHLARPSTLGQQFSGARCRKAPQS